MSLTLHKKSRKRYQRALLRMEALEPRTLLSATPQFYTVENVIPAAGAYDAQGNLWVFNANTSTLDQVAPIGTSGTGAVLASIDLSNFGFINRMTLGPDGQLYLADDNGGIDEVVFNGTDSTVTYHEFTDPLHSNQSPRTLTVSNDGAVWFATYDTSVIGRWTPATGDQFFTLPHSDSYAWALSANADNAANTVWVGMLRTDGEVGAVNHALSFSYNGSTTLTTVVDVPIATNRLTAMAADASGGVWAALANSPGASTPSETPDQVVHITSASVVSAPINIGNSVEEPLNIFSLAIDGDGNIWTGQLNGNTAFYIADNTVTPVVYSGDALQTADLAASPVTGEISVLTASNDIFNPTYGIANIIVESSGAVEFEADLIYSVSAQENTAIPVTPLATFFAPDPTIGSYSAIITWSNGAVTPGTVTLVGDQYYEVTASMSANTFRVNGTYTAQIRIVDGANVVAGTIEGVTAVISDTPLATGSISTVISSKKGYTVDLTLPFTDDVDANPSWYIVIITWGDGSTSKGLIKRDNHNPGQYYVTGSHKYKAPGNYALSVDFTAIDDDGTVTHRVIAGSLTV